MLSPHPPVRAPEDPLRKYSVVLPPSHILWAFLGPILREAQTMLWIVQVFDGSHPRGPLTPPARAWQGGGMDLDLNITPGRPGVPLTGHVVRPIELEDLGLLDLPRDAPVPQLAKIRTSHHKAARLLAIGMGPVEVSLHTGYTPQRITDLQKDPAFQELLAVYSKAEADEMEVGIARLRGLMLDAADEIAERLAQKPEDFSNKDLRELMTAAADRSGFGPQTKSTNVNVNVDMAGRLEAARRRAQILDLVPVPEGTSLPLGTEEPAP